MVFLWGMYACTNPPPYGNYQKPRLHNHDTEAVLIRYSEKQLELFLDSIGALSNAALLPDVVKHSDSVFLSRQSLNKEIDSFLFSELMNGIKLKKMKLATVKKIVDYPIDSASISNDSVTIGFISFDRQVHHYNEFAISIGSPGALWENDYYFFKQRKLIARHHNFYCKRFAFEHFTDTDGKTVIYYLENFGSGSGLWQYNYFFYKYEGDRLIPALNLLCNGNLRCFQPEYRNYWFKSLVKNTRPLTLKVKYDYSFNDTCLECPLMEADSTELVFKWDPSVKNFRLEKNDKLSLNRTRIFFYPQNSEIFFINTEYEKLKGLVNGKDSIKRKRVFHYLNSVKNAMPGS